MIEKQKTLLELLRNRPRWTRFQNFDVEESNAGLEKCLEEIEFSVEGLVAELQKRILDLQAEQKMWYDCMVQTEIDAYKKVLGLLVEKDSKEGKSFLERSQDYADRLEKEKQP